MQIFIENETGEIFNFRGYKKLITRTAAVCGEVLRIPEELEVNLMIVFPETIRTVNAQTRGIDRVTDVLSFPYFEFPTPGDTSILQVQEQETILGDILICAEKVISQAKAYGHSQKRELAYLLVHSLLHLTGYDHMTAEDEQAMKKQADALMDRLGLQR